MRLHIVRHADPDYANNTITAEGHLEAKALSKRFLQYGLDKIYTSPMGRAMDTGRYTSEALGVQMNIEEWTQEVWDDLRIDGTQWGDIAAWDIPGEIIRGAKCTPSHDMWKHIPHMNNTCGGIGELHERIKRNSDEFLKRQGYEREDGIYRCIRPNRDKIAVFCHGGFGLCWLAHLLEIPMPLIWSGFWLPPSSVTTILFDERSEECAVPRCIGMGDVSHLYEAGLPVKPRGITSNFY